MLLRQGIGTRPEDRPAVPRGVHAVRAVGSAQLVIGFVRGEQRGRGDGRRSSRRCRPIVESSDYQTSTPSQRLIRARILTQRCRGAGAVLRERRGVARRWRLASACVLVATPCLALAAAASETALTRTCCVSAAPWARAARVARPAAGSGFVPAAAPSTTSCLARLALSGRESSVQSVFPTRWSRTRVYGMAGFAQRCWRPVRAAAEANRPTSNLAS